MEKTIERVLDDYFSSWNEGFISKSGDGIRRFMSKDFTGYWGHSKLEKPMEYYYDYNLEEVLVNEGNASKSFEILSVKERGFGHEMVIFGREVNTISGESFPAQCMFIWRKEQGDWKLLREYIELER